ncbi:MAG: alpha/beta hydrolase [Anaerolineales bacterium]|nr:alpha/beta hydrolase [Anaerolineales bacterium]
MTRLHCLHCGDGPPLIMVPATISKIENWVGLAQFMGQRFRVTFFELPGHGQSSLLSPGPFSSARLAEVVGALADALGHSRFSLMGFSFGGMLAMAALQHLRPRVEQVILASPALTWRAFTFSPARRRGILRAARLLRRPGARSAVLRLAKSPAFGRAFGRLLRWFGRVEGTIPMREVFAKLTDSTLETLSYQFGETLEYEFPEAEPPFTQPCYFGMSVRDPLLDFETTLAAAQKLFANLTVQRFDFPYHQPPQPPSFAEVNREYARLLDWAGNKKAAGTSQQL